MAAPVRTGSMASTCKPPMGSVTIRTATCLFDGTRYFAYDDENQLISVTISNAWQNQFVYDGKMRRRIERDYGWIGGSWTETNEVHFIYDGNVVVQERNANNLPTVSYTRGNDLSGRLQGAGGIGGLLARTDMGQWIGDSPFASAVLPCGWKRQCHLPDVSEWNLWLAKYLYDPFGNTLAQYGALAGVNNYRFSSKELNANSGLYYYLYRFYDPNLQRWLNRDPLEEAGGVDLYTYVGNNPIDESDPLGLMSAKCIAAQLEFDEAIADLADQFERYNPLTDILGGIPILRGGQPIGRNTVPGGHAIKVLNAINRVKNALDRIARDCKDDSVKPPCDKKPEPKPAPVPNSNFINRMAEITGLSGSALYIYLIVSEGSRAFPPRDLVPAVPRRSSSFQSDNREFGI